MSLGVICPACKARMVAPEQAAGKKAKCPKCQTRFIVPGVPAPAPQEVVFDVPTEAPRPTRPGAGGPHCTQDVVFDVPTEAPPAPIKPVVDVGPVPPLQSTFTDLEPVPERKARARESGSTPHSMILGLAGCAVLFVGAFAPLVSLPILGSVNYFMNGHGDGVIVLALAGLSAVLCLLRWFRGLWLTGLGSVALVTFGFVGFQVSMQKMAEAQRHDTGAFAGLGAALQQSIQLQWGWALLAVGAVLLVAAAVAHEVRQQRQNGYLMTVAGGLTVPVTAALVAILTLALGCDRQLLGRVIGKAQPQKQEGVASASQVAPQPAQPAVVPAPAEKAVVPPATVPAVEPEPPTPFGQTARHGMARMRVVSAAVRERLHVYDPIRRETVVASLNYLAVHLRLTNEDEEHFLSYPLWGHQDQKPSKLGFLWTLKDDLGNDYGQQWHSGSILLGAADHGRLRPGETSEDILLFEPPVDRAKELILSVPYPEAKSRSDGAFLFSIPTSAVRTLREVEPALLEGRVEPAPGR